MEASCTDCQIESKSVNSLLRPTNAHSVATHLVDEMKADVVYGCGGGAGAGGTSCRVLQMFFSITCKEVFYDIDNLGFSEC